MPRPGTPIIHPRYEQHHRHIPEGASTATCRIQRPSTEPGVFDPNTGTTTPAAPTTLYDDLPCRVQEIRDEQRSLTGEQIVTTRRYMVIVSYDVTNVQVDDWVELITATDPTLLGGRKLFITDVMRGSVRFERDLIAVDDQG